MKTTVISKYIIQIDQIPIMSGKLTLKKIYVCGLFISSPLNYTILTNDLKNEKFYFYIKSKKYIWLQNNSLFYYLLVSII